MRRTMPGVIVGGWVVSLILAVASALPAMALEAAKPELAAEAIEVSGLGDTLGSVGRSIGTDALADLQAQAPAAREAKFAAAWARAAEAGYGKERLARVIGARLSVGLTAVELGEVVAYYRDGIGRRFVEADRASDRGDAGALVLAHAAEFKESLASNPERAADYQKIIAGFRLVDLALPVVTATALATEIGVDSLSRTGGHFPLEALREKAEEQAPLLKGIVEGTSMITVAVAYKALSDADVKAHAMSIAEPALAKFVATVEAALGPTLHEAGAVFHGTLTKELGK